MIDQHGKTITLGPRYALRVEDIRPGLALRIQCLPCGHDGTAAPISLGRADSELGVEGISSLSLRHRLITYHPIASTETYEKMRPTKRL
jgi:hypothetical protein